MIARSRVLGDLRTSILVERINSLHVSSVGAVGTVQKEERLSRAAGERGPAVKRGEGPGETEGVSLGAISPLVETQSGPGRIRGQSEGARLLSFLSSLSLP